MLTAPLSLALWLSLFDLA